MAAATLTQWPTTERLVEVAKACEDAQELLEHLTHEYKSVFDVSDPMTLAVGSSPPSADDVIALSVFCDQRKIDLEWIQENLEELNQLSTDALYLYGNTARLREVAQPEDAVSIDGEA